MMRIPFGISSYLLLGVLSAIAIAIVGCGVESTSSNGSGVGQIIVPRVGTQFLFSYNGASSQGNTVVGNYEDSAQSIDSSLEGAKLSFTQLPRIGFPNIVYDRNRLHYESSYLLYRAAPGSDDYPFTVPFDRSSYTISRDSVITSNGFYIATGTYDESATYLGASTISLQGGTYSVWNYRFTKGLRYAISYPVELTDTMYASFSPDLGYFTHFEVSDRQRSSYVIASRISISLDTVLFPK